MRIRAIIGVIALYALVLNAFLGTLASHLPGPAGPEICAQHDGDQGPLDGKPACPHQACCVPAATLAEAPSPSAPLVWPVPARVLAWRAGDTVRARAPPDQGISPRGPPAA